MKKSFTVCLLLFICLQTAISQYRHPPDTISVFFRHHLGLGMGIDYGGLGFRISYMPVKQADFFAAAGWALVGLGFNAGMRYRLLPEKRACPFIGVMYGYNAAIGIQGAPQYNRLYYGASFTLGLEIYTSKHLCNYLSTELIVPVRSGLFTTDLNRLKSDPNIDLYSEPLPFGIALGYHLGF